jgi:AcrR family transcriptional regulator
MPKNTPEQTQARRDEITAAALRCFSRNGFHATSMDDVIAEAGLSAGAVYRYFSGKQQLVEAAVGYAVPIMLRVLQDLTAQAHPPPPVQALERLLQALAEIAAGADYDLSRVAVHAWSEALREPYVTDLARTSYTRVRGEIRGMAEHWQADGVVDASADPGEVSQAFFALLLGTLLQRLLLGDITPDSVARGLQALTGSTGAQP